MQTFESLGLSAALLQALEESNFKTPTEIQEKAIPLLVDSAIDFLGLAQTGTGKTAAFGLPLLDLVDPETKTIQALVLSPTRELAQQIQAALDGFSKHMRYVNTQVVYGGENIQTQIKQLRRRQPNVLVATPGRLMDLIRRKELNLSNVRTVVLDEADEMLNMGFKEDIDAILSFTRPEKNIWLFSATMPPDIRRIVNKYMHDPVEVNIQSEMKVNLNIEHKYAMVKGRDKRAALARILDVDPDIYALIFCRTKASTQNLANVLTDQGYPVEAIHGDLSQAQRNTVMRKFKNGTVRILVATDVAARGIDVDNLTHVLHYDLPDDLAFYTHRSGRTARAGKKGIALSIVTPSEIRKINMLEGELKIKFQRYVVPIMEEVKFQMLQSKLDSLLQVNESEEARTWATAFVDEWKDMSIETIIAKYLTASLKEVKEQGTDLNASGKGALKDQRENRRSGDRYDRAGRGDRNDRQKGKSNQRDNNRSGSGSHEENMERFYISIGKDDDINKSDVLKIVCDTTGVRSKYIGKIQMFGKHTLFDVEKSRTNGVVDSFNGLQFNGRKLKVSVDSTSKG